MSGVLAAKQPLRISIVNGICVKHDAISASIVGEARALREKMGVNPRIYSYKCECDDLDFVDVSCPSDILRDDFFNSSDIIIYHYGIYYPLFNTIFAIPKQARSVVRYHNVTPAEFLGPESRELIEKSVRQKANIASADAIWADSQFNKDDLIEYGIDERAITVEPLFVDDDIFNHIPDASVSGKSDVVNVLYVGRFVKSKGVSDLVRAASYCAKYNKNFKIQLVGNEKFSDPVYILEIKNLIDGLGVAKNVEFIGTASADQLKEFYRSADVFLLPSYHEGFCVPLIEAFVGKCIPVTYSAGNLKYLSNGLGVVVDTGDVEALSKALMDVVEQLSRDRSRIKIGGKSWMRSEYDGLAEKYVDEFRFESFAQRTVQAIKRLTADAAPVQGVGA